MLRAGEATLVELTDTTYGETPFCASAPCLGSMEAHVAFGAPVGKPWTVHDRLNSAMIETNISEVVVTKFGRTSCVDCSSNASRIYRRNRLRDFNFLRNCYDRMATIVTIVLFNSSHEEN
jgi:hypothetical protein